MGLSVSSHSQPGSIKHCIGDIKESQAPLYLRKICIFALWVSREVRVEEYLDVIHLYDISSGAGSV